MSSCEHDVFQIKSKYLCHHLFPYLSLSLSLSMSLSHFLSLSHRFFISLLPSLSLSFSPFTPTLSLSLYSFPPSLSISPPSPFLYLFFLLPICLIISPSFSLLFHSLSHYDSPSLYLSIAHLSTHPPLSLPLPSFSPSSLFLSLFPLPLLTLRRVIPICYYSTPA